ncbi:DNA helicase [Tanacetum coccineum]
MCPKNTTADEINETVLEMLHGKSMVYTSSDEAIHIGSDRGEVELLYPPEYLNTLQFSGFPSHRLELKVGAPIMLLRNMNLQGGMCNGTRVIIKKLWSRLIKADVITGNRIERYWEFPSPSPSLSYPVMKQLANKEKIDLKNQSKCFL